MVPAWSTSWTQSPRKWKDFANSLDDVMKTFQNIKNKVPMLQKYAQKCSKLNDMPWIEIAREIADGVKRKDARLDSADNMMSIEDLDHYVKQWRTDCETVNKLIQWELFGDDGAKKLADFSRPGAYEQGLLC